MKLSDALTQYRTYGTELFNQRQALSKQLNEAKTRASITNNSDHRKKVDSLQLSLDKIDKEYADNKSVIEDLSLQYSAAWNLEVARQQADPESGMAATLGKIMATVVRMSSGDKVPASDEKKLMEYNSEMYARVKQTQATMAAMKERQREYDSVWEDEERKQPNPMDVADNTKASGVLPDIPASNTQGTTFEVTV